MKLLDSSSSPNPYIHHAGYPKEYALRIYKELKDEFNPLCFAFRDHFKARRKAGISPPQFDKPLVQVLSGTHDLRYDFLRDPRGRDNLVPTAVRLVGRDERIGKIKIPIGEYGQEWAQALLFATLSLCTEVDGSILILAEAINSRFPELINIHTFRKNAVLSLLDGIESIGVASSFDTIKKIPTYEEDPKKLLHDLIAQQFLQIRATQIPPFTQGPIVGKGFHFKDPVQLNNYSQDQVQGAEGEKDLNPPTSRRRTLTHTNEMKAFMKNEKTADNQTPTIGINTHLGCPVANAGIAAIAEVFLGEVDFYY